MWAVAWRSLLLAVWTFIFLWCLHKEAIGIPEEIRNIMKGNTLPALNCNVHTWCQSERGNKMLFPLEEWQSSKPPWNVSNKLCSTPEGTGDSGNRPSASATSRQGVQRLWSSYSRRYWGKWQTTGWPGLSGPRRHWDSEANGCPAKAETDLSPPQSSTAGEISRQPGPGQWGYMRTPLVFWPIPQNARPQGLHFQPGQWEIQPLPPAPAVLGQRAASWGGGSLTASVPVNGYSG